MSNEWNPAWFRLPSWDEEPTDSTWARSADRDLLEEKRMRLAADAKIEREFKKLDAELTEQEVEKIRAKYQ